MLTEGNAYFDAVLSEIDVSFSGNDENWVSKSENMSKDADIIDMEIVAECTGLHETVFLSLLVLCFRGVKPMVRAKWALYAVIFIFVENLIRIISGYYLINMYDFSTWDKFHYFWWHTGQYALIMGMFVFWVMTIAGKPENKSIKKNFIR